MIKSVVKLISIPVTACYRARDISDIKRVLFEGKVHAATKDSMFITDDRKE